MKRRLPFLALVCIGFLATSVSAQTVTSFTLVNADTNKDIRPLKDGDVIDMAAIGTEALNVRANTEGTKNIGSVVLKLSGATSHSIKEGVPVWALFGDTGGDYKAGNFNNGKHTLTATPYPQQNGKGGKGKALTVKFSVKG